MARNRNDEFANVSTTQHINDLDVWVGITLQGAICIRTYSRINGELLYEVWQDVRADGTVSGQNCIEDNTL